MMIATAQIAIIAIPLAIGCLKILIQLAPKIILKMKTLRQKRITSRPV